MHFFCTTILVGLAGATGMQILRGKDRTRQSFLYYFYATTSIFAMYACTYSPVVKVAMSVFGTFSSYLMLHNQTNFVGYAELRNSPCTKLMAISILQIPLLFAPLPIAVVGNIVISYAAEYLEKEFKIFEKISNHLPNLFDYLDAGLNNMYESNETGSEWCLNKFGYENTQVGRVAFMQTFIGGLFFMLPTICLTFNGVGQAAAALSKTTIEGIACIIGLRFSQSILGIERQENESIPTMLARSALQTIVGLLLTIPMGHHIAADIAIVFGATPLAYKGIDKLFEKCAPAQVQTA